MATYRLPTGGTVQTLRSARPNKLIEFVTRNEDGDVISTVHKGASDSLPMLASLRSADALACRLKSSV
ncbi:hypothetical protein SEA_SEBASTISAURUS_38 [Streptomyces phage Sebastisaurus]|uniref:Uncharacterized protein n=1 Tax=Streptomyces phage Sebastisaurus TaxID=2510572 RepID=A0A411B3T0_9CAUD|nr:hypothetical protein SEA_SEBASTISAURUS_38 [Streptomyces phage Sebastisaurus]